MRRLVFPVILASGLVMLGAVPASAEPAPAGTSAKAAAGKKVCKITSSSLPELSGIVATKNGYAVINDSTDVESQKRVFFLDDECEITKRVEYTGKGPFDTEDMVLSADGATLWIADTGDNAVRDPNGDTRATIALWSMPVDGSKKPKIHRLAYPDGDKHDAEALLFNGDGTPIIVTKETVGKPSGIYVPKTALKTNNEEGVPLEKVGEVELPRSDTAGTPFARLAQGVVTGGAVAPKGTKVVLRTYLDAFEWDVTNGDVLAALKKKPRQTGLPNEPFGEAISYTPDGKQFNTVSDIGSSQDPEADSYILGYTPATKVVEAKTAADAGDSGGGGSWYSDLSLSDITYLVGAIGVLGAILVGAGVFGIMRSRKKAPPEPVAKSTDPTAPGPLDARPDLLSVGGPAQRPGVYGGNRPPAGAPSGPGVYGAKPPAPQKGGGVYGAGGGARPPQGQPAARPAQPAPGRPGGARPGAAPPAQPGRPGGVQPRPGGVQPGRPGGGGQPGRPGGGQQGRPGQGGGRPGGGVYGAPPGPPPANGRPQGGPQRPSGFTGGGRHPGHPDGRPDGRAPYGL
ncbi:hypothetical protein [Actinoplanes sp. NPDC026623]|uniref:hypothetical protein n=1 Tax=Actinoplanes sp. NPDC026623 TaxID=3155610 RepID=UPI0033D7A104